MPNDEYSILAHRKDTLYVELAIQNGETLGVTFPDSQMHGTLVSLICLTAILKSIGRRYSKAFTFNIKLYKY